MPSLLRWTPPVVFAFACAASLAACTASSPQPQPPAGATVNVSGEPAATNAPSGAPTAAATDWAQIVALYDLLLRLEPSPVVELNRAVAVAMHHGPAAGLAALDAILGRGALADYHLAHAARADLCRRLGRTAEARAAYRRALALVRQAPERRFLERRLAELSG